MIQPEHYRRKAQEALEMAGMARGEELPTAWLEMARAWSELADFHEKDSPRLDFLAAPQS